MFVFLYICLGVLLVLFLILGLLALRIRKNVFSCRYDDKHTLKFYETSDFPSMQERVISFKSKKLNVNGKIYSSKEASSYKGLVILVHALGPGHKPYMKIINELILKDYLVLAYDTLGCELSEGKKVNGFTTSLINLNDCLNYVENDKELSSYPIILLGHSMGGYAVNNITRYKHKINGIISISSCNTPYTCLYEELTHSSGYAMGIFKFFFMIFDFFKFGKKGLYSSLDAFNESDIDHLIIGGTKDTIIDYNFNHAFFKNELLNNPHYTFLDVEDRYHQAYVTKEAAEYDNKTTLEYYELKGEHQGHIPSSINEAYYKSLDRDKLNELDPLVMETIINFIQQHI